MTEELLCILDEVAIDIFKNSPYKLQNLLGQGSFGQVYEVREKSTGKKYAAKLVTKATFGETTLWPLLKHKNVLELKQNLLEIGVTGIYDAYLMPYVGPDLFHVLHERSPNFHADSQAYLKKKIYAFGVLKGIEYLHSKRLCHLDIKEENILICERSDKAIICDFSTLTNYQDVQISKFGLHMPSLPPEVAMGNNNFVDGYSAEMWTYGIFLLQIFTMQYVHRNMNLVAELSYATDILPAVLKAALKSEKDFYSIHKFCKLPNGCAFQLFSFINKFLAIEPGYRATASDALLDPFFADVIRGTKRPYDSENQIEEAATLLDNLSIKEKNEITLKNSNWNVQNDSIKSNIELDVTQQIKRHKGYFLQQRAMNYQLQSMFTAQSIQFSRVDLDESGNKDFLNKFQAESKHNMVTRFRKRLLSSVSRKLRFQKKYRRRSL